MNRPARVFSVLFAIATIGLPREIEAQQNKHWLVCGGNSFNTCASVDVTVGGLVSTVEDRLVTLRVMNLSGMNGTYAASVFTKIGFFNVGGSASVVSGSLSMTGDERAGDVDWKLNSSGQAPAPWVLVPETVSGGIELDLATASTSNFKMRNGIANQCLPSGLPADMSFWWNDCYTDPLAVDFADYVEISFQVAGLWDLAGTELLVKAHNGPGGAITQCVTGPGGNCGLMIAPEPISMLLLGTGLAGMGGIGVLRRRKESEGEESDDEV